LAPTITALALAPVSGEAAMRIWILALTLIGMASAGAAQQVAPTPDLVSTCEQTDSEACALALIDRARIEIMRAGTPDSPGDEAIPGYLAKAITIARAEIEKETDPEEKAGQLADLDHLQAHADLAVPASRTLWLYFLAVQLATKVDMPEEANKLVPALRENWAKVASDLPEPLAEEWKEILYIIGAGQIYFGFVEDAVATAAVFRDARKRDDLYEGIISLYSAAGRTTDALKLAGRIRGAGSRADALSEIAVALAKAGQTETSHHTFATALEVTKVAGLDEPMRERILLSVAWDQLRAGFSESALETADLASDPSTLAHVQAALVRTKVDAGLFDEAQDLVRHIEAGSHKAEAQAALATGLVQAGRFDDALELARLIEDHRQQTSSVTSLVTAHLDAAGPDATILWVEGFTDLHIRAHALDQLAEKFLDYGQDGASDATDRLDAAIRRFLATNPDDADRSMLQRRVAGTQINAMRLDDALQTASEINESETRDAVFADIATSQIKQGNLDQALLTADRMQDPRQRAALFREIGVAQAEAGDLSRAEQSFAHSIKAAMRITQNGLGQSCWSSRDGCLSEIAAWQAHAGLFDMSLVTASGIAKGYLRDQAFSRIVLAQLKHGRLAEAMETTARIEDDYWQARALAAISEAQIEAGRLDLALQVAGTIEPSDERWDALDDILETLAERGDKDGMRQAVTAIEALYSEVEAHPDDLEEYFADICMRPMRVAQAKVKAGDFAGALRTAENGSWSCERAMAFLAIASAVSNWYILD
jgi:tetratricopeptide (TPR) repeat protein